MQTMLDSRSWYSQASQPALRSEAVRRWAFSAASTSRPSSSTSSSPAAIAFWSKVPDPVNVATRTE